MSSASFPPSGGHTGHDTVPDFYPWANVFLFKISRHLEFLWSWHIIKKIKIKLWQILQLGTIQFKNDHLATLLTFHRHHKSRANGTLRSTVLRMRMQEEMPIIIISNQVCYCRLCLLSLLAFGLVSFLLINSSGHEILLLHCYLLLHRQWIEET